VKIVVYGNPAPQGSKRFMGVHGGRGVMIESSKAVKPWREAVKFAALDSRPQQPIDAPLVVRMVFTVPKPKSAPKKRITYPGSKPDLSKLVRSTEDALTDAGIWKDDARVVEYERLAKVYPGEDAEALEIPGCVIVIRLRDDELFERKTA
jgi:Holliday junction resolvase RusA-like endonuclease